MPTYSYRCANCDYAFDQYQAFTDDSLSVCPNCGEPKLRKVFNSIGVTFNGSGFYRTDARADASAAKSKSNADSSSKSGESSSSDSSSKSESKSKPSTSESKPSTSPAAKPAAASSSPKTGSTGS